jgi:hypothetical protein
MMPLSNHLPITGTFLVLVALTLHSKTQSRKEAASFPLPVQHPFSVVRT